MIHEVFSVFLKSVDNRTERIGKIGNPMPLFMFIKSKPAQTNVFTAENIKESYKKLNTEVRALGVNIPPLVNAYIGLSPTIKSFGAARYIEFGDVIEFGILVNIADIYEEKKNRHIESYLKFLAENSNLK